MLIQDDFGLQPLDNGSRMHLMDIIKDRYGKKSTLITSQLPVKDRYDVIGKKHVRVQLLCPWHGVCGHGISEKRECEQRANYLLSP